MKIKNKEKFLVRMLELIIVIVTIILTILAIRYATIFRGYKAFGGEYLIPVLGICAIMIIETIYEDSKNKNKKRRCNKNGRK